MNYIIMPEGAALQDAPFSTIREAENIYTRDQKKNISAYQPGNRFSGWALTISKAAAIKLQPPDGVKNNGQAKI